MTGRRGVVPVPGWPAQRRDGRVRVGIVIPLVWLGGVELWTCALVRALDPDRITWIGTAVEQAAPCDPMARALLEGLGPVRLGPGAVESLAAAVDVLIVWGSEIPHRPRPCKILLVAHGQGDWTRIRMAGSATADGCAAVSTVAAGVYPAAERHRVKVIPNAVEPDRIRPRVDRAAQRAVWGLEDPAVRIALFVGRPSAEKRPGAFLDMVAALPPEWAGVIVGRGLDEVPYRAHAAAVLIAKPGRVVWAGPTADVGSAYAASDIGIVPSEHEGACLVLLEMMAAGLPVVMTPVGHAPEMAGLLTLVGPLAAGPELAAAVLETLERPDLVERLEAARAHVRAVHGPKAFGRAWSDLIVRTKKPRIPLGTPAPAP